MAASSAAAPMAASSANHPPAASSSADAFRSFLFENRVQDTTTPALFQYDDGDSLYRVAPWRKEAKFFKRVRISAVALVKMTMHAHSGGDIEVMGLMQGKVGVVVSQYSRGDIEEVMGLMQGKVGVVNSRRSIPGATWRGGHGVAHAGEQGRRKYLHGGHAHTGASC